MRQTVVTEENEDIEEKVIRPKTVVRKTTVIDPGESPVQPQKVYKTKKAIFRTYQVIWYILGVIEALLTFRILLRFIGANPSSGFTSLIYAISAPFAAPFLGVVSPSISGNNVMEWSTLIAMIVWALIAWGLTELFQIVKPVDPLEVEEGVDKVD